MLVTAATGYIGRNLVKPLEAAGYRVRAAARSPRKLSGIVSPNTDVAQADAFDPAAVAASLAGVDTAFYLIHTLGRAPTTPSETVRPPRSSRGAAADAGVRRIVFFGGLGANAEDLSEHLASRHEVGRVLASTGVEVVEFRASIVIGSGSTSFEMIRNLVEKLPAMTTPRWVRMPCQPIAIHDVASYLVAAVRLPEDPGLPAPDLRGRWLRHRHVRRPAEHVRASPGAQETRHPGARAVAGPLGLVALPLHPQAGDGRKAAGRVAPPPDGGHRRFRRPGLPERPRR